MASKTVRTTAALPVELLKAADQMLQFEDVGDFDRRLIKDGLVADSA